jgi:hypothetical protein
MEGKSAMLYKSLVIGVIVLFIGIGIQPAFATVEPENIDTEYYDVKTEFVGLEKEHTTKLTKEEIEKLNAYIESTLFRLNQTTSLIEAIGIYKCAILELDKYGLLGDIGIKETEKLVLNFYQKGIITKVLEHLYNRKQKPLQSNENKYCLIFGWTSLTLIYTPRIINAIDFIYEIIDFITPFNFPHRGLTIIIGLMSLLWYGQPFCIGRLIIYIEDYSSGYVTSIGLLGIETWIGELEGKLEYNGITDVGVVGFTGLKIFFAPTIGPIYLGYAQHASIDDHGGPWNF